MESELGIWRRIARGLLVRNEDRVGFLIETVKKFDAGSNKEGSSTASQPVMNTRKLDEQTDGKMERVLGVKLRGKSKKQSQFCGFVFFKKSEQADRKSFGLNEQKAERESDLEQNQARMGSRDQEARPAWPSQSWGEVFRRVEARRQTLLGQTSRTSYSLSLSGIGPEAEGSRSGSLLKFLIKDLSRSFLRWSLFDET